MHSIVARLGLVVVLFGAACGSGKSPIHDAGGGGAGGASDAGSGGTASGGSGGAANDGSATDAPADVAPSGLTAVRAFVFHELTALNPGAALGPVLSGDGSTVAFVQNGYNPNHVFAMKFDGTGMTEVDTFVSNCFCQARVDISGDGTGIVSSDAVTLRYVRSDGSAKKTLLTLTSNEISDFRITADGSKVFFIARRDGTTTDATPVTIGRGVWVVNPDGTGLQQVVSAAVVAPMYNVTVDKVFPFSLCGISLDASKDGGHVVFGTGVGGVGDEILGANGDGTGLHKIAEASAGHQVHISSDGARVGYVTAVGGGPPVLYAAGFDGTGAKMLADGSKTSFGDGCGKPSRLTGDGARYFMSDVGLLFNTDGSGALALAPTDYNGDWLVAGSLYGGSMSDDGTRFVFLNGDAAGQAQVVSMQMSVPTLPLGVALGVAPAISDITMTPPVLTINAGSGMSLVTAKVTAMGTLRLVIANFVNAGLKDPRVGYAGMNDEARDGDLAAGDGVFSSNRASAGSDATAGVRNLRVRAESTVNQKRHATVIELSGVTIMTLI